MNPKIKALVEAEAKTKAVEYAKMQGTHDNPDITKYDYRIAFLAGASFRDELDEWVKVDSEEKPTMGERIEIFSPEYKEGDPMRHRIIDEQFLSISKDATHWRKLSEPLPAKPIK